MTSGFGASFTFDESNRTLSAAETSGGVEYYAYGADNKRVYRMSSSGAEYCTFYGAFGEKLGVFQISVSYSHSSLTAYTANIYFAGQLIVEASVPAYIDRGGSNRGVQNYYGQIGSYTHYYPFGEEIGSATTNDHEKFATYTRDSYTGIDYADQRYYTSTFGGFNSPDPYMASGGPYSPASWNRYSYTRGDPVNRFDRHGTCDDSVFAFDFDWDDSGDEPCDDDGLAPPDIYSSGGLTPYGSGENPCDLSLNPEGTGTWWYQGNCMIPESDQDAAGTITDPCMRARNAGHCYAQYAAAAQSRVPNAVKIALNALNTIPDCAKLIGQGVTPGGQIITAALLLQIMAGRLGPSEYGNIGVGNIDLGDNAVTVPSVISDGTTAQEIATITLQDLPGSVFAGTNQTAQAAVILHELGHAIWDIFGPGTSGIVPDGRYPGISRTNTMSILATCLP